MKTRIKIEERYNGEILYTPQVKINLLSNWRNIVETDLSISITYRYFSKDEAKQMIIKYLNHINSLNSKKIKKTKYETFKSE